MSLTISTIKESISNGLSIASNEVGKFRASSVIWIKSGYDKSKVYLQDKNIAAVSVLAICVISSQIFVNLNNRIINSKKVPKQYLQPLNVTVAVVVYFGSLGVFLNYFPLPLNASTITIISLSSLIFGMK